MFHPRIAFGPGGTAVAVWEEEPASGRFHVFAARMRRGRFGRPQRIAILDGTVAGYDVAIDSTGRATAIWLDRGAEVLMSASAAAGRPFGRARELSRVPGGQHMSEIGLAASPGARHVVASWGAFPRAPGALDAPPTTIEPRSCAAASFAAVCGRSTWFARRTRSCTSPRRPSTPAVVGCWPGSARKDATTAASATAT